MLALQIDGALCPIASNPKIPIGFTQERLLKPQQQRSGMEFECQLLRTPYTELIFGCEQDIHAVERFNESHHSAALVADGATLMEGTLLLVELLLDVSEAAPYRVRLRSGGAEWAKRAAYEHLSDVDIDWSGVLTMEGIADSWSLTSPVRFLPFVGLSDGKGESIYDPFKVLLTENFYPFISLRRVVEHIFASADYEVESRFLEDYVCSELMVSGDYGSQDTSAERSKMAFCSGRQSKVSARANSVGMVYASPGVLQSSVGNIVTVADPTLVDDEGRTMSDTFTTADTFAIDDDGYARFKAQSSATVGFLLHLHYITDYRIASRHRLTGFDRIEALPSSEVRFEIANRFHDCRNSLVGGVEYRLCIFDWEENMVYNFALSDAVSSMVMMEIQVTERFTTFVLPEGLTGAFATLVPLRGVESDWAIYEGYVTEQGTTEVEVDIRIAPQHFAKGDTFRFNKIMFSGAEPDMELTLLSDCRLSPYFDAKAGYGSVLTYKDITRGNVWLIDLYESLCQMFNLVTYTDKQRRKVYIESLDDFYTEDDVFDWSHRIDFAKPIRISDAAIGLSEHQRYCYRAGDKAVEQQSADEGQEFGSWQTTIQHYGTVDSVDLHQNRHFAPTVSRCNAITTAPSAYVLAMEPAAMEEGSLRVVRYQGLRPLPLGEYWAGSPVEGYYPLGAFCFPGNSLNGGFTLGFGSADESIEGLSIYHRPMIERRQKGRYVTLSLRLRASDIENLFKLEALMPSIRSTFRLTINGESHLYRLVRLETFDPSQPSTECTFLTLCEG